MTAARLHRLSLTNFRSYRAAHIAVGADLVVLLGPNGAGKTNLIEAVSLLAPGRGLRRATLEDLCFAEGDHRPEASERTLNPWAVAAEIEGALGLATLGTGIEPSPGDDGALLRKCRIDREPVGSASAFADHLRIIWLTPAMDGLFSGPASERRRFLDRLVLAVDAEHASRVSALERSLRSRNRLLEESRPDTHWLDAVEHETAELAVSVAALRAETARRLQGALAARQNTDTAFPRATIALEGWMEAMLLDHPAVEVEDRYRKMLRDNRARDAAAGRTLDGPHLSDLAVVHAAKNVAAGDSSTGEQKALLLRLMFAHVALLTEMTGFAPVLLLDEAVAHLDPGRRHALFETLAHLNAQVWMTGADPAAFSEIAATAQIFEVTPGQVAAR
ncbi:MAG: DNA replication/repair protein RecF [Pseudorhodoplanes sp.]